MIRTQRFDLIGGAFEISPSSRAGALALDATPALAKVLPHEEGDELLPPYELSSRATLDSFVGVPVTVGHPAVVDMSNVQRLSVGYARGDVRFVGDRVLCTLIVTDAAVEAAIRRGDLVELSVGWFVREDRRRGIYQGKTYNLVRRDCRANHIALLPRGSARAGEEARVA